MRYLQPVSVLILIAGLVLFLAGALLDVSALATVVGMMLIIAAVVKIVTVRIWNGFFDSDTSAGE
jgi:hypothetical protein